MCAAEIQAALSVTQLTVRIQVAASTQDQALKALCPLC